MRENDGEPVRFLHGSQVATPLRGWARPIRGPVRSSTNGTPSSAPASYPDPKIAPDHHDAERCDRLPRQVACSRTHRPDGSPGTLCAPFPSDVRSHEKQPNRDRDQAAEASPDEQDGRRAGVKASMAGSDARRCSLVICCQKKPPSGRSISAARSNGSIQAKRYRLRHAFPRATRPRSCRSLGSATAGRLDDATRSACRCAARTSDAGR